MIHREGRSAVLFDMDGVLVDTEGLKARAHRETIAHFGGILPEGSYERWMGSSHDQAQTAFLAAARIQPDPGEYARRFEQRYGELLRAGVDAMPGAEGLLQVLHGSGVALALVTSSHRWMVEEILRQLPIGRFFDAEVTTEDVVRAKPAPDAYLCALELLAIDPSRAVVMEDTDTGMDAGLAAGCRVVGVRHRFNGRHRFAGASAVLEGLEPVGRARQTITGLLSR